MSDALLRRTIRRCTALLLIVLGTIAVEVASLEYPDGGNLVGGGAIVAGAAYLGWSVFIAISSPVDSGDQAGENGAGDDDDGPSGGDDENDSGEAGADSERDDGDGDGGPPGVTPPPFAD